MTNPGKNTRMVKYPAHSWNIEGLTTQGILGQCIITSADLLVEDVFAKFEKRFFRLPQLAQSSLFLTSPKVSISKFTPKPTRIFNNGKSGPFFSKSTKNIFPSIRFSQINTINKINRLHDVPSSPSKLQANFSRTAKDLDHIGAIGSIHAFKNFTYTAGNLRAS